MSNVNRKESKKEESRVVRVDSLFAKAVEDRKKRMEKAFKRSYGYSRTFDFPEITRIFGAVYFKEVFGDIPIEQAVRIIEGVSNA
ncbi:MAG: hypothetical protein JJE48_06685 [Actinobacteria bacterium]|nr:hypothetical protein [Actinomycetota bacterium]